MKITLSIMSMILFYASLYMWHDNDIKEATYCIGVAIFLKLIANDTKK